MSNRSLLRYSQEREAPLRYGITYAVCPVSATALAPLIVLGLGIALDLWVYGDAKQRMGAGRPVTVRAGDLVIRTPTAWAAGCLILWIVFFPLYLSRPE